jgi:hypothetical protein
MKTALIDNADALFVALRRVYPFGCVNNAREEKAFIKRAKLVAEDYGLEPDQIESAVETTRSPGLILIYTSPSSIVRGLRQLKYLA